MKRKWTKKKAQPTMEWVATDSILASSYKCRSFRDAESLLGVLTAPASKQDLSHRTTVRLPLVGL